MCVASGELGRELPRRSRPTSISRRDVLRRARPPGRRTSTTRSRACRTDDAELAQLVNDVVQAALERAGAAESTLRIEHSSSSSGAALEREISRAAAAGDHERQTRAGRGSAAGRARRWARSWGRRREQGRRRRSWRASTRPRTRTERRPSTIGGPVTAGVPAAPPEQGAEDAVRPTCSRSARVSLLTREDEVRLAKLIEQNDMSRQERPDRGQPAPGRLDRQALHGPRADPARPDPGGQPRPDPRGREVRLAARLQVLHLRDLVDPPGDLARDGRPVAHDPDPGPHGRADEPRGARASAR